jgi:hypothetical protein
LVELTILGRAIFSERVIVLGELVDPRELISLELEVAGEGPFHGL